MPDGSRWNLNVLVAHEHRVPGVVAALVAGDDVVPLGEQVDDLALALVAPLGADDDGCRHVPQRSSRLRDGSATSSRAPARRYSHQS